MQQTFQVNASDLDNRFIKSVQDIFGDRKLKIVVEDIAESNEHKDALLDSLFGSWESEETGEELVKMIYSNRNDSPRDIEL
ncbi:MAG: hypothetical protein J7619_16910 [Dyadobacter sp.]|uniref:hypothetical protein n=1 Tax=Dyadobacter sp. TaxID=1914288 RepID=UPI001B01A27F|nr:hypothetical protein [Dyadobacter sp.]MBO9614383.1 hypothetical protein [Dyadobacter sp.]